MVKTYIFHRRFSNISHNTNIHLNNLCNYYFVCVVQGGRRLSALYWPAATAADSFQRRTRGSTPGRSVAGHAMQMLRRRRRSLAILEGFTIFFIINLPQSYSYCCTFYSL